MTPDPDGTLVVAHGGHARPYRSPEQAKRLPLTRRSDIWSLGLTILAMFKGDRDPWDLGEHARRHLEQLRASGPVSDEIPRISEELAALLERCFREEPSDRPRDMLVLAEELQRICDAAEGQPYPRTRPEKVEGIADALNNVGVSHLEMAKFELQRHDAKRAANGVKQALSSFDKALAAEPLGLEARYNRGVNRLALTAGADDSLRLWDVTSGRCLQAWEWPTSKNYDFLAADSLCFFRGDSLRLFGCELSSDGRLGLISESRGPIQLLDVARQSRLWTHMSESNAFCLLSSDASRLTSMSAEVLQVWHLDWDLDARRRADWDEGARVYLEGFVAQRTPALGNLPTDRPPEKEEITAALTRCGTPTWNEQQFQDELVATLNRTGYGWLRPEGVRAKLEEMRDEQVAAGGVPAAWRRFDLSDGGQTGA